MTIANFFMIEVLALTGDIKNADVYGPSYGEANPGRCFLLEFVASFLFIFIIHGGAADPA